MDEAQFPLSDEQFARNRPLLGSVRRRVFWLSLYGTLLTAAMTGYAWKFQGPPPVITIPAVGQYWGCVWSENGNRFVMAADEAQGPIHMRRFYVWDSP